MKRWLLLAAFVLIIGLPVTAYNSGVAPAIMGHTVDEIEGLRDYILSLVPTSGGGGGVDCPSMPLFDSMTGQGAAYRMPAYKYGDGSRRVPDGCLTDIGCVVKWETYYGDTLYLSRQFDYRQDATTNKWWSTYWTSGVWANGDASIVNIYPPYGWQYIVDDYKYGFTDERSRLNWTFVDISTVWGMKVYVCTYGSSSTVDPGDPPDE